MSSKKVHVCCSPGHRHIYARLTNKQRIAYPVDRDLLRRLPELKVRKLTTNHAELIAVLEGSSGRRRWLAPLLATPCLTRASKTVLSNRSGSSFGHEDDFQPIYNDINCQRLDEDRVPHSQIVLIPPAITLKTITTTCDHGLPMSRRFLFVVAQVYAGLTGRR
ncbi:hypothetical protein CPB85DRAFT_484058 [Mucidula mucida]|nr:hypothetical protein CPB85DRAFT_484058 [Mucidula mucida]